MMTSGQSKTPDPTLGQWFHVSIEVLLLIQKSHRSKEKHLSDNKHDSKIHNAF